jgi:hypothetical protein
MGRRQQLSASALLLLAAGLLTRADAALLEAMSGCTLKPAQNLRVVRAEPTRLEVSLFPSRPNHLSFFGRGECCALPSRAQWRRLIQPRDPAAAPAC